MTHFPEWLSWSLAVAICATGAGLASAYYWNVAAKIKYEPPSKARLPSQPGIVHINPGGASPGIYVDGHPTATIEPIKRFIEDSAAANKTAAIWSAVTAALAGASALLSALHL